MAQAERLYNFEVQTTAKSAEVNAELDNIIAVYNAHDVATGVVHGIASGDGALVSTLKRQSLTKKLICIDGLTGTGALGKVYYIDASLALQLASYNTENIGLYQLVFGTGVEGIGAVLGDLLLVSALSFTPPQRLFLGAAGVLINSVAALSSGRILQVAKMLTTTRLFVNTLLIPEQII